jgi:hypothetical protein
VNPIEAQSMYGAAILSFLGGPHWGLAMVGVHGMSHCYIIVYLEFLLCTRVFEYSVLHSEFK